MKYRGRQIDPIELWSKYVEFPPNVKIDGEFLPLVTCPNPEHDTFKRHFQINTRKGLVHCFAGCGISGTFERAISLIEGIPEREARRIILQHTSLGGREPVHGAQPRSTNSRDRLHSNGEHKASLQALEYSTYIPEAGMAYLEQRGITDRAIAHFEIGWDSAELRIVIPAKDLTGTTRFLVKRSVRSKDRPKYLYSEGFPKTSLLYGACDLDPRVIRSEGIVVVEGSFDRIALWQHGIPNVAATLGTGISAVQARIIMKFRPPVVFLMLDRDTSGIAGIEIARKRLPKVPLKVCRYPSGKFDPAELARREAIRAIERAVPAAKVFNPNAKGSRFA